MANFDQRDFFACCGSSKFAAAMAMQGPLPSLSNAVEASRSIWWNQVNVPGWLEAFAAHPRIGDTAALKRDAPTAEWSKAEQSTALKSANDLALQELAEWNQRYEEKFGFTFLICASGKTSAEILTSLKERFHNRPIQELQVAAAEQQKITEIRLSKLYTLRASDNSFEIPEGSSDRRVGCIGAHLSTHKEGEKELAQNSSPHILQASPLSSSLRPPITTHVLDVSRGRPGAGIGVLLEMCKGYSGDIRSEDWVHIGSSVTDNDGRSGPLMLPSSSVIAGKYKLTFNTGKYFLESRGTSECFYPYISVAFEITPTQVQEHFHVPVLLSPFSYTTYRGS